MIPYIVTKHFSPTSVSSSSNRHSISRTTPAGTSSDRQNVKHYMMIYVIALRKISCSHSGPTSSRRRDARNRRGRLHCGIPKAACDIRSSTLEELHDGVVKRCTLTESTARRKIVKPTMTPAILSDLIPRSKTPKAGVTLASHSIKRWSASRGRINNLRCVKRVKKYQGNQYNRNFNFF
jgi:hypothetical protein